MLTWEEFRSKKLELLEQSLLECGETDTKQKLKQYETTLKQEYNDYIYGVIGQKFFLDEKEHKKLVKKAETDIPWKREFNKLFGAYSFDNDIAIEALFFVFISLFTKHKKIRFGIKEIRPILHFFWCQASGTGKDQAFDMFVRLLVKLAASGVTVKTYEMAGSETPEVLLNHFERRGERTITTRPVKGVFEEFDLLLFREASYLFYEKRSERQSKSELLLQALEGRDIEKKLIAWNGLLTRTKSKFCFIGGTRPVGMKNHVAYSGLLQRCLTYFRWVTTAERGKMLEQAGLNTFTKNVSIAEQNRIMDRIVMHIKRIRTMLATNNVRFENLNKLNEVMTSNLNRMLKDNVINVRNWELREIMESFISRYRDLAITISILEAFAKHKTVVTEVEVQSAFNFIWKVYESVRVFIEHTITEDIVTKKRQAILREIVSNCLLKTTKKVKYNDMVKYVSRAMARSESYVYCLCRKLMDDGFIDKDFEGYVHLTRRA